jgi:hypothetical protein
MPLTEHEHNILAVAINERLTEIGQPHAPYYEPPSLTRSQPGS